MTQEIQYLHLLAGLVRCQPCGTEMTATHDPANLFGQTVKAAQQYSSRGYIAGLENQDRWPTDETTILKASQWLHRNVDIIRPETGAIWLEAIPSALNHWQHTGELREYDTGNNPNS